MCPAGKARASKRHRQNRKLATAISVVLLVLLISTLAYLWFPKNSSGNQQPQTPAASKAFTNHYLALMHSLNSSETKTQMLPQLDSAFNQTDLFTWEQTKLTFIQDPTGWFEDPTQILNSGKGVCAQWSIVYVSACLALGHQSRLVVAADSANWNFIHVWAEDYCNGTWVHVDPSDKVWNNPSRYQSWDWGSGIGSNVKIYAFEDCGFEEVTTKYSS
jgi:hypothetical protein